ncbi:MAG: hypothetical protein AAB215_05905 [Planctomycetota bacterium]
MAEKLYAPAGSPRFLRTLALGALLLTFAPAPPAPAAGAEGAKGLPTIEPGKPSIITQVLVSSAHADKPRRNETIDGDLSNTRGCFWSTFQETSKYPYDTFLESRFGWWFSLRTRFPYDFVFRFYGPAREVNCVQVYSKGNTFGASNVEVVPGTSDIPGVNEGTPGYWPLKNLSWGAPVASFSEGEPFTHDEGEAKRVSVVFPATKAAALKLRIGKAGPKAPEIVFVNEAVLLNVSPGGWTGGGKEMALSPTGTGAATDACGENTGVKAVTLNLDAPGGEVTVKVIDPSYTVYERAQFLAAFQAAGGKLTITCDFGDLVVPKGSKLLVSVSGAKVTGGTAHACDVKEALPEFQTMQVNQAQLWFTVQQLRSPRQPESQARRESILAYDPSNAIAKAYKSLVSDVGGPRYAKTADLFAGGAGAPPWAQNERAYLRAMRLFLHWWIDERQMADGQMGGHYNDDPEFTGRWYTFAGLMSDEKVCASARSLCDGLWSSDRLKNGYIPDMYNIEHSNEETTLTGPIAQYLSYGDPVYIERNMETFKNIEWWSAVNDKGHRHFLAERYSGTDLGPQKEERYEEAQSLLPGAWVLWHADIPRLRTLLQEFCRTYVAHDGKTLTGCIPIVEDHTAAQYLTYMMMQITGDESYLKSSGMGKFSGKTQKTFSRVGGGVPDTQDEVDRLLAVEYMHTRAQPLSDRIHRTLDDLKFQAQISRATLGRPAPEKVETLSLFVGWEGMDPDAFASQVTGGDSKSVTAEVHNFTGSPLAGRMRVFALDHGEYDVAAPGAPKTMELRRGDTVPFTIPASSTGTIAVKQTKPLPDVRGLADLGAGHLDAAAEGGKLFVRIHNVGAKDAENVVVRVSDAAGKKLGEETVASLPYPADLLAKVKDLSFAWDGKPGDKVKIEIDPDDKIPEITEQNNRVEIEVRAGALPPPVGSDWSKGEAKVAIADTPKPPENGKTPPEEKKPPPADPKTAAGDAKKALADYKKALKAAGKDFGGKAKSIESALGAIQDPKARAGVMKDLVNAFKGSDAESVHAWAAGRFPGGAPAEPGKSAVAALKAALQKEKDASARATAVAKAAASITDAKEKGDWAKMLASDVGKMKPDALFAWFSQGAPPVVAPTPAPGDKKPPEDGAKPPEDAKSPPKEEPKAIAAGDVLDGNGFPLPVPGEADDEPYEGYGANKGGRGGQVVEVEGSVGAISSALSRGDLNGAILKLKSGDYDNVRATTTFKNVTVDGGGATFWHSNWLVNGQNLVIRNVRLRNGGDNISLKAPCERITLAHVSTTGSVDDGMSVAYGTKNATVQYCFFGANTRSTFIKYGADKISHHHNWLVKQWIRGPLIHAPNADVRNNVQEDWWLWAGPRFEAGSSGNAVNNVYINNGWAPSKLDSTSYAYKNGKGVVYIAGTLAIGFKPILAKSGTDKPLPAPSVTTHTGEEALKIVKEKAGCRPLDAVDQKIIDIKKWIIGDELPFRPMVREGGKTVEAPPQLPQDPAFKPGPRAPLPGSAAGQKGNFDQVADPKTEVTKPSEAPAGGEEPAEEEGGKEDKGEKAGP